MLLAFKWNNRNLLDSEKTVVVFLKEFSEQLSKHWGKSESLITLNLNNHTDNIFKFMSFFNDIVFKFVLTICLAIVSCKTHYFD